MLRKLEWGRVEYLAEPVFAADSAGSKLRSCPHIVCDANHG